jgi:lysophospholipase L1-like esterase
VGEADFRRLPGVLAPDQNFIDRRDRHLPHHVTTNALGYRGGTLALFKQPGEFRILLTGDSFAYGDFVNDEASLPAQLEERLRGICSDVQVVNAGLDAATITDETEMIGRGLVLTPDLVVLLFSENDVADLSQPSMWARLADNRRAKSRAPFSVVYPLLRRTALWNFVQQALAAWRAHEFRQVRASWAAGSRADSTPFRLRGTYQRLLLQLRDTLRAQHPPLVLVAYPQHFAIADEGKREQLAWLTRMSSAAGIPTVDLLDPLLASGLPSDSLYLLPYDGHPSPQGYAVSATFLAHQLLERGFLRPACGRPAR